MGRSRCGYVPNVRCPCATWPRPDRCRVSPVSTCTPSPASAIRAVSSTSCAATVSSSSRILTRITTHSTAANCVSTDRASWNALSLLANAYVDLGTYGGVAGGFGGVTPYVGAGIGATRVNWGSLRNTSCDINDPGNCDESTTHDGEDSWRFTYALMAGASIDLTCNWKADAGYRFRQIAGGDMFGYANNGGPGEDDGFYVHEARLGLRYTFNSCEVPYVPPVEPVVYK